ncbi:hypothetical protein [Campylobacter sp. US33a]|uniref:hypothetical protein n=1 Tax=Campylobacter sp. US33a TaxID=2498120 RepID=UPI001068A357|nr:hypothetical protein [Campylobacter sp. US33a]TEY00727.1 hypothetical protein ELQ16_08820 [Campylobacter sp. US33a]
MKKILFAFGLIGAMYCSSYAVDLDDVIDDVWDIADDKSNQTFGLCYRPSNTGISGDICSIVNNADLSFDACAILPPIPGFEKRKSNVSFSGLKSLCRENVREFADISSTAMKNVAENLADDTGLSDKTTLPNGLTVDKYLKRWNAKDILGDDGNIVKSLAMKNDNKSLKMLMDYDKIQGGKGSIAEIDPSQIKAPSDLSEYRKSRQELAKSFYISSQDMSPSSISAKTKQQIQSNGGNKNTSNGDELAQNLINGMSQDFEFAKANEIGNALAIYANNNPNYIALPTEDVYQYLRSDLKLQMVHDIRKQQIEEAKIIADITEKWERKRAIASLIADKEVIMSQKFDEEGARKEIEKIIAGANDSSDIPQIP